MGLNNIQNVKPTVTVAQDGSGDYNGTTSTTIQAAIDFANSVGGGTVLIKKGTYTTSTQINPKSNVDIIGEGISTIISHSSGSNIFYCDGQNNFKIKNMKLDGNLNNVYGVKSLNSTNVKIEDLYIQDCYGYAIKTYINTYVTIKNNFITNCGKGDSNSYGGIDVSTDTYCNVLNNTIIDVGKQGINPYAITYGSISNNIITNVAVEHGIHPNACKYVTFDSNKTDTCFLSGIKYIDSYECQIINNVILNSGSHGIICGDDTASDNHRTILANNVVKNSGGRGIAINNTEDIIISNNYVENSKDYQGGIALSSSTKCTINGNICKNNRRNGIVLIGTCTDITCVGNLCYDDGAGTYSQETGILETSTSDYNIFISNILRGNTVTGITIIGVNTDSSHNIT